MGYAGDMLGRNAAMTFTLTLVAIGAVGSAAFSWGDPTVVYAVIIVCRFFLGIGVGGVYPLSATKAAEDGGDHHGNVDPTAASWAFFWQVPGTMVPWLFAYLLTYSDISTSSKWRLILGLGSVPALMVVAGSVIESYHLADSGSSSPRHNSSGGSASKAIDTIERRHQSLLVHDMLQKRDTWYKLAVTGGGWFIYDVAYYGVNLFGGEILQSISDANDDNVSSAHALRRVTLQQLIALAMGLPACILAIYSLKVISIKNLQVWGFFFIAGMFVLLACLFYPLKEKSTDGLFAIYCMLLFSLSFGPNLATFILPAHTYPKEVRATFNGISAACGKLGAFTGVYMFGPLADVTSYPVVMVVCAVISVLGAIVTYAFIPKQLVEDEEDETVGTHGNNELVHGIRKSTDYIYA